MPDTHLVGCCSRPLIGYLKALGVLRVVSLQADRSARGRWRDGVFELRAELTDDELADFLLDRYSPSPVISPWNGGSGFHPKDRKEAILALEQAAGSRFAPYQSAIRVARNALDRMHITEKPAPEAKLPLVREIRRRLPDGALPWLDAAIVIAGAKVSYPPLLGSGGNDGRYDFSNNYAHAVVHCLISSARKGSLELLLAALNGGPVELQRKLSLAHLSRDSSPNNSPYGEADSLGNPWDLILAIEGTLLLAAGAARRHGAATGGTLAAPFTVRSTAAGYGSAVGGESGRAEMWLPLWSGWATCAEIDILARESRAQVGRGRARRQAMTGLDYARAAGAFGVAKGIDAFERYAILERAGQSSLAVPAGRLAVSERHDAARAIQSIDRWLRSALRFGAEETCPRDIQIAIRRVERATFALASRGNADDTCEALEAIGAVEHAFACSRTAVGLGRVLPLTHALAEPWIKAADDGTAEFSVAVSIASLRDRKHRFPALRDYLHGTQNGGTGFDPDCRHLVRSSSPIHLLAAIHARRHVDAARDETPDDAVGQPKLDPAVGQEAWEDKDTRTRLEFELGTWCKPQIARRFAAGELDDRRILRLIYGLALLDHTKKPVSPKAKESAGSAVPAFDVLALAWMGHHQEHLPRPEARGLLGPRAGWAARLAGGAIRPVVGDCALRLRMAGLPPVVGPDDICVSASSDTQLGPRLCAALLLRMGSSTIENIAKRITFSDHLGGHQHRRKTV